MTTRRQEKMMPNHIQGLSPGAVPTVTIGGLVLGSLPLVTIGSLVFDPSTCHPWMPQLCRLPPEIAKYLRLQSLGQLSSQLCTFVQAALKQAVTLFLVANWRETKNLNFLKVARILIFKGSQECQLAEYYCKDFHFRRKTRFIIERVQLCSLKFRCTMCLALFLQFGYTDQMLCSCSDVFICRTNIGGRFFSWSLCVL